MKLSFSTVLNHPLSPRPLMAGSPSIDGRRPLRVTADKKATQGVTEHVQTSDSLMAPVGRNLHKWLLQSPQANRAVSHVTAPFVKAVGNLAGPFIVNNVFKPWAKPPQTNAPPLLSQATIHQAERVMADRFRPQNGKVIIGISGSGFETVHCFVVSGVGPKGQVRVTHALPSYGEKPENYAGIGGAIREMLDKLNGNDTRALIGVTEQKWTEYAVQSKRNTIVLLELEAHPSAVAKTLRTLRTFLGRPYDKTLLAAETPTDATTAEFYCTELSAWLINTLRPGTVKMSSFGGYPVFQVADHMRATDVHGGPLKVLYNGHDRLDIAGVNPLPRDR